MYVVFVMVNGGETWPVKKEKMRKMMEGWLDGCAIIGLWISFPLRSLGLQ